MKVQRMNWEGYFSHSETGENKKKKSVNYRTPPFMISNYLLICFCLLVFQSGFSISFGFKKG